MARKSISVGVFLAASLILKLLYGQNIPGVLIGQLYGIFTGLILVVLWNVFFDKKRKKQKADYKNALLDVAKSDNMNAVGLLLEEVYYYDFALRQEIRAALMRLLPRLQTGNPPALDAPQRKILAYLPFVTGEINPNLRLAALQALAQVGDAEALRVVKNNRNSSGQEHGTELGSPAFKQMKPIKFPSKTESAYVTYFQSAVANCITKLEARLARESAADTLLRASQSNGSEPGTLLRPATNTQSEAAELLRAANGEANREKN